METKEVKIVSGQFFLVTLKYTKQLENGTFKRVSENFLVQTHTFGSAETMSFEYLEKQKAIGDINVTAIKQENFNKVILSESENFFKMTVSYTSTDDKKIKANFLVEAEKIEEANTFLTNYLKDDDYQSFEIINASLSSIKGVF